MNFLILGMAELAEVPEWWPPETPAKPCAAGPDDDEQDGAMTPREAEP